MHVVQQAIYWESWKCIENVKNPNAILWFDFFQNQESNFNKQAKFIIMYECTNIWQTCAIAKINRKGELWDWRTRNIQAP